MKLTLLILILLISGQVFGKHVVLVSGLNNEQFPEYFSSFKSWLNSRGFDQVSTIHPSSLNTVSGNKLFVKRKLLDLYQKPREPLVIIGHSKGSLETANTLATYAADFPAEIVTAVIYANTPFQGSPYMAESIRDFEATYGRFGNQYNPVYLNALAVLRSLSTETILSDLKESHSRMTSAESRSLSERTFFVRTTQSAEKVSETLKKSALFLKKYGANDGLIPVENQKMAGLFGTDLGIWKDIDHGDVFVRKWSLESKESLAMEEVFRKLNFLP